MVELFKVKKYIAKEVLSPQTIAEFEKHFAEEAYSELYSAVVHLQQYFADQVYSEVFTIELLYKAPSNNTLQTTLLSSALLSLLAIWASFAYFHFWAKRCLRGMDDTQTIHLALRTHPNL